MLALISYIVASTPCVHASPYETLNVHMSYDTVDIAGKEMMTASYTMGSEIHMSDLTATYSNSMTMEMSQSWETDMDSLSWYTGLSSWDASLSSWYTDMSALETSLSWETSLSYITAVPTATSSVNTSSTVSSTTTASALTSGESHTASVSQVSTGSSASTSGTAASTTSTRASTSSTRSTSNAGSSQRMMGISAILAFIGSGALLFV